MRQIVGVEVPLGEPMEIARQADIARIVFFFKQKTAYEIGLGIPAEPLFRSFKALMFLTLMRPSLVLFLVLWLKLVKDFLEVRWRLARLPFLISCLVWLDLVASLPLIKERILVIILLLHFLSLMLGSVLVLMLPLLVWLTPDLRIKKSLLKCNWTIRKRLPRCKMRLKKRLLAFSRRLHARIRKTR